MVPYIFFGCCARDSSKTYLDDLDIHIFSRSIFDRTNVHVNRYAFGKVTRSPFSRGEVIAEGGKNSFMLRLSWKKPSNRRLVYVKPTMGTRERKYSLIGMKRAGSGISLRKHAEEISLLHCSTCPLLRCQGPPPPSHVSCCGRAVGTLLLCSLGRPANLLLCDYLPLTLAKVTWSASWFPPTSVIRWL